MEAKTGQGGVAWSDDHHCLICGTENPIGLKLKFEVKDGGIRTQWRPDKRFQGYADVVHGGIIAAVLDEVMVNLPWKRDGVPVVSAEINVRFVQPARVGELLTFTAEGPEPKRMTEIKSACVNESGALVAEATAKCVRIKNPNL